MGHSEKNRKVLCAHCTCMAGLAEACTHIAALLFWVEMLIKIHNSKTVTDKQAYWVSLSNSDTFLQPEMYSILALDLLSLRRKA